jgi:phosphate starvation-inducible protein PhoH and related proteins
VTTEPNKNSDLPSYTIKDPAAAQILLGEGEETLKIIRRRLGGKLFVRGNQIFIDCEDCHRDLILTLFNELFQLIREGLPVYPNDVEHAIDILASGENVRIRDVFMDKVYIANKQRVITPKSLNQKQYIDAIRQHDIVFGIGPAGTGKTYLAMAMAVAALKAGEVDRIIMTRPAVEAGEKLGFLPGDLIEKVNPYLRPLYDALHDMMSYEKAGRLVERGAIEVAPLAFMRGRTLNDSFVILDEAQNSTKEQMKMFLTRLGFRSKAVITGDITQIDLGSGVSSGLVEIQYILRHVEGLKFTYFNEKDVVRHRLVQEIILAYEAHDKRDAQHKQEREE